MKILKPLWNEKLDALISAFLFVLPFLLYLRTLAPSIAFLFDDTLEMQYVIPRLGILHPTGYPLFTLLGKLFTLIVPFNDNAFRLNLLSAFAGALAVVMVYLVTRHLVAYRMAALLGALTFAVGQTFWSQAVIAESYTTQMLIVAVLLYLALIWREEVERGNSIGARHRFYALALALGIGLTHHRLILLLYPAIAVYILLIDRSILRDLKTLSRAVLLFLLPLLLYLYLPLRGNVGSADGTYQNTLPGFCEWVMAQQYTVFLTGDPFQVQRDAAYYATLFSNQFTMLGLVLAGIGLIWLLRQPREWTLLTLALIVEAGFAFNYRTANVYVHFLTTFLLIIVLFSAGADALLSAFSGTNFRLSITAQSLAVGLLLLIPLNLINTNFAVNDLSNKWDVHDEGFAILNQPFENNATVIGLGGEITRLRYFQEARGIKPELQTLIADKPAARLAAVEQAIKQNRVVYLTRPLEQVTDKYSLSSFGSLIRVQPKPATSALEISHPIEQDFGAVKLLGYDLDTSRLNAIPNTWHVENGRVLRVTLYWQPQEKIENDALVSIKVLRSDDHAVGQIDRHPVSDAYPTNAWRKGEVIVDTYDVPIFLGATPSDYKINVTMYDAQSGAVIGQRELEKIALKPDFSAPRDEVWNVSHIAGADFGGLSLAGYSLETGAPVRPGNALPLTLLWRAGALKLPDNLLAQIWLEDANGKHVTSRDTPISLGYPPFQWQPNMYVRDWPLMRVPANVGDGKYDVKLAVSRNNELLGSTLLPFFPTVVDLGQVEIKNRARVMTAPRISQPLETLFDNKIKLLGYDLQIDGKRTAQITLFWKSLALMDTSYTVFVHLLDAKNNVIAAGDSIPGNGDFPTTGWIEEEHITDTHTLSLNEIPSGTYHIEIGVYEPASGVRLKTGDAKDSILLPPIALR